MTVKPGWARKRRAAARKVPSTTQERSRPPASSERPIWNLNRDEQRIMVITVVGGLASIILGVVIIGGAIALARTFNAHPGTAGSISVILDFAVIGIVILWFSYSFLAFRVGWRLSRRMALVVLTLMGLIVCFFGLALLGLAAGIK